MTDDPVPRGTPKIRVLLIESDSRAADGVEVTLRGEGHHVERCHPEGQPLFPCRGVIDGGCPLEEVDVAVVVRAHPWPRPTASERGVTCALRHGLPLVVAGQLGLNPYEPWAAAMVDGTQDVVGVCQQVAEEPDREP